MKEVFTETRTVFPTTTNEIFVENNVGILTTTWLPSTSYEPLTFMENVKTTIMDLFTTSPIHTTLSTTAATTDSIQASTSSGIDSTTATIIPDVFDQRDIVPLCFFLIFCSGCKFAFMRTFFFQCVHTNSPN